MAARRTGPTSAPAGGEVDTELEERKLNMSLAELELSVRATNCLESEGIATVRDLISRNDEELLEVRNFGEDDFLRREVEAEAPPNVRPDARHEKLPAAMSR